MKFFQNACSMLVAMILLFNFDNWYLVILSGFVMYFIATLLQQQLDIFYLRGKKIDDLFVSEEALHYKEQVKCTPQVAIECYAEKTRLELIATAILGIGSLAALIMFAML